MVFAWLLGGPIVLIVYAVSIWWFAYAHGRWGGDRFK